MAKLYAEKTFKPIAALVLIAALMAFFFIGAWFGYTTGVSDTQKYFCHVSMNGTISFDSNEFKEATGLTNYTITSYMGDVPCQFTLGTKFKYLPKEN